MPTNIQEPRKRHPSETDDQWEDVLNVSECMIHMNEIASVSNGNDDKLALVTPEKKKANPYRNKKLLKHPNGYSDSFKRREEKAHYLNKKEIQSLITNLREISLNNNESSESIKNSFEQLQKLLQGKLN